MNKKSCIYIIISVLVFYLPYSFSLVYSLPENNGRLVGKNLTITTPKNNKFPLEHFAAKFQIGLGNILAANPGIDVYLPDSEKKIFIPQQLILPNTLRKGIIINIAEMRLYFYPKKSNIVFVFPIGIGQFGKDTPSNWTTSIWKKKASPIWTPTEGIRKEYAEKGEVLPQFFPAGPDNPMGLYALYIGRLYAIHGTNVNFGIGLRVSHGCVRLRNSDIKYLFNLVPIGTRVQFINEPVKATLEKNGLCYIEVHSPLSSNTKEFNSNKPIPISLSSDILNILKNFSLKKNKIKEALLHRSGIPICINEN